MAEDETFSFWTLNLQTKTHTDTHGAVRPSPPAAPVAVPVPVLPLQQGAPGNQGTVN